jgi:fructose-1,6-bisphosphatase II
MAAKPNDESIERNISLELVRVTEAAAVAAARHFGMGDKNLVDGAAVTAMREWLGRVSMDGVVVIGEGEKDQAPMLYIGERIGDGSDPKVDIAVDPVDGTTLTARGLPGASSVIALSGRGTMNCPRGFHYVDKLVVGHEMRDVVHIDAPVAENLRNIARATKRSVADITVVVLDRPRHEALLSKIREAGARVKLISDGDVEASIDAALPETAVDVLMGVGGTPEAVLSAAAMECLGGFIQCKPWPKDDAERQVAMAAGVDLDRIYDADDLIHSDDVFFAATGVSTGGLLTGVRFFSGGAQTHSISMRGRSGTIRRIESRHNFSRTARLSLLSLDR